MLEFPKLSKVRLINQMEQFDIANQRGIMEYNLFCLDPDVKVIGKIMKTVPGIAPGPDGTGGEPSKLLLIVEYILPIDKLTKES